MTTNHALVRGAGFFFREEHGSGAPVALTADALTNLLWLKKPKSAPNLPWNRLVADAYAATQPDEALWRRFAGEVDRLQNAGSIYADDYYLLRGSLEARAALMERTLGDEGAFSQGDVPEILRVTRERVQANGRAEAERARTAEAAQRVMVESQLESWRGRERDRRARVRHSANLTVRLLSYGLFMIVAVVLTVGTVVAAWSSLTSGGAATPTILAVLQLVATIFGVWNWLFGTTIRRWARSVELWGTVRVENLLLSLGRGGLE